MNPQPDPRLEAAKRHVKHVRDLAYHLITFLFVNGLLVLVDLRGGTGEGAVVGLDWAYWPILFWGFGLLGHAVFVFLGDHRVQKLYERQQGRSP